MTTTDEPARPAISRALIESSAVIKSPERRETLHFFMAIRRGANYSRYLVLTVALPCDIHVSSLRDSASVPFLENSDRRTLPSRKPRSGATERKIQRDCR
jgi:hypothetical protein